MRFSFAFQTRWLPLICGKSNRTATVQVRPKDKAGPGLWRTHASHLLPPKPLCPQRFILTRRWWRYCTDAYRLHVQRAFADYDKRTADGEKSGHLHNWILKEGELWVRRVKLMEAGHLKMFRIYARVPPQIK